MAKILKCPRCQERIDVTDLSGGSTVKCEACGTMVRLPSGNTGKVPQAAPPPPPPPPAPARREKNTTKMHKKERGTSRVGAAPGRQTDLFKKMSSAKAPGEGGRPRGGGSGEKTQGSNTGMIIAIAAAAVVILGGVAFAVLGKKDKDGGKTSASEPATPKKPQKKKEEPRKTALAPTPVQPTDTGVFKPGARGLLDKQTDPPMPNLSSDGRSAYESLVSSKVADVVAQDYSWVTYVIDGMLSDNEAVAKGSFDAMHQIINKRKLDASQSELGKKADVYGFNMPQTRADEYRYWAQWYFTLSARRAVDSWREAGGGGAASGGGDAAAPRVAAGNAATEPWEQTLRNCRSGGFHNSSNPEYYEFQKIKGMGKSAYPHLIRFIDHEDTSLGTTAVLILKELSGRSEQPGRVTEANKSKIKEEWEGWLKSGP